MSMKMRKSQPKNNKYYIRKANGGYNGAIAGKPTIKGANVLCNCVGYANGRFNEIIGKGKCVYQLVCNAENFIERATALGLNVSSVPTLGGIMVWQKGKTLKGSDGAGHVAIVEDIISENEIITSESGYGHFAFKLVTRRNTNGRWGIAKGYKFRGCIINPSVTTEEHNGHKEHKESKKTIKVGAEIKIKKGANQYGTTRDFASKVYTKTYKVIEIRGNRVVFADGKTVMGAVSKNDCIIQ